MDKYDAFWGLFLLLVIVRCVLSYIIDQSSKTK